MDPAITLWYDLRTENTGQKSPALVEAGKTCGEMIVQWGTALNSGDHDEHLKGFPKFLPS